MEDVKISTSAEEWKKLISTLISDCYGFKTSVEEITENVVETVRELELEMEREDVTKLLKSHGKTLTDDKLFLLGEP